MIILQKRRLTFGRAIALFLIFLVAFPVSSSFITTPAAKADNWAGWDAINTIYYNPSQEDHNNPFLYTAAQELKTYLGQMSGRSWTVATNTPPATPAIYLSVDATQLSTHGDEAFRLIVNNSGVTITGKTAIAVRWGAYYLLDEKLGVRWFFKNTAWTVVPASLSDLNATDEIHEPDYFWRYISLNVYAGGNQEYSNWCERNRMAGSQYYMVYHSYGAILDHATGWYGMDSSARTAYYNAHPEYFLPNNRYPNYPWQLNFSNNTVAGWAIDYARDRLEEISYGGTYYDSLPMGIAPISPNDGGGDGFDPPYDQDDYQAITDYVLGAANAVAADIAEDYPDKYVGVLNYAAYCDIPSIDLEPNLLVIVTQTYNYGALLNSERLAGIKAKGAQLGWYDYVNVWAWYADSPVIDYDLLNRVKWLSSFGVKYYAGEATDSWGCGAGVENYVLGKLLWDSSLNVDDILADFYTKAFGPAATVMQKYYEVRGKDAVSIAQSFNYLNQAETLATGNSAVLTRIRQLEYYNRYVWKYKYVGKANLTLSELQSFYTFLCKVRDTWIIDFGDDIPESSGGTGASSSIRSELISRGQTSGQVNALRDFVLPTDGQTATWLSEAMSAFSSYMTAPECVNVNLMRVNSDLEALGDTTTVNLTPLYGNTRDILVYSSGNENVTVRAKTDSQFLIEWYNPLGMKTEEWEHIGVLDWTSHSFTATNAGYYLLHATRALRLGTEYTYIDVQGRPASVVVDPRPYLFGIETDVQVHTGPEAAGANSQYFYVPANTSNFTFGTSDIFSNHVIGSLVDPDGVNHNFDFSTHTELWDSPNPANEMTLTSPVAGLWKVIFTNCAAYNYFWFKGIPPLVWYDPEYLLVPAAGSAAPPVLASIGNKSAQVSVPLQFTVSATDPDNDPLTYSASNLPPWATFNPATRTFSGTANQTGTYTNVQFTVSDGSLTDSENITITVNSSGPGVDADINNDGAVNILDTIRIVQHWGESGASGWIPEDVNNDGTVDILDVILVGQNWTG